MLDYEQLDSGITSAWSKWVLTRVQRRFVLQHNIRIEGVKSPYCYLSKHRADAIVASNDPDRFQKEMNAEPCKYFQISR